MAMNTGAAALAIALACAPAHAGDCWRDAAERYGVNPYLLYAIAKTESNLNPDAMHRNQDGSVDIGLMQINSRWLPQLRNYGIDATRLRDACTNIHVGAWVLAQNVRRLGNSWNAVGAYNARSQALRERYAGKVYRNLPPEAWQAQRR